MKTSLIPVVIISSDMVTGNQLFLLIQNLCVKIGFGKAVVLGGAMEKESMIELSKRYQEAVYVVTGGSSHILETLGQIHPKNQVIMVSRTKTAIKQAEKFAIPFFKRQNGCGYAGLCQHLVTMLS